IEEEIEQIVPWFHVPRLWLCRVPWPHVEATVHELRLPGLVDELFHLGPMRPLQPFLGSLDLDLYHRVFRTRPLHRVTLVRVVVGDEGLRLHLLPALYLHHDAWVLDVDDLLIHLVEGEGGLHLLQGC